MSASTSFSISAMCCSLLRLLLLVGCWFKLLPVVEKNKAALLNMYDQIFLPVAVHVFKRKRYGSKLLSWADQGRADVDSTLARVIPWYLNDNDVLIKVLCYEVTIWIAGCPMTDIFIGLVGPRHTLMPVVLYPL